MEEHEYPVHPLRVARIERGFTQEELAQELGLGVSTVRRAEQWFPLNIKSRCIISDYFKKSPKELGLMGRGWVQGSAQPATTSPAPITPHPSQHPSIGTPTPLLYKTEPPTNYTPTQALDLLGAQPNIITEQHAGAWLALGTSHLAQLFDEGWSLENILEALRVVLQSAQGLPKMNRRKLLELGATALVSSIPLPGRKQVSESERVQFTEALGKSIGEAWKLFHTSDNEQVLAIGRAQLYLIQQTQTLLYPDIQYLFYSAIYRLIGATLFFQERYTEAEHAHNCAYTAALEGANAWNMAQSRSWQAYVWNSQSHFIEAFQTTEAACNLISQQQDIESIRLHARLLAFAAENAALSGNEKETQSKLHESGRLLEYFRDSHEEFDRNSWLQTAGICALHFGHYDIANKRLQQSLNALPPHWKLRYLSTAVPLMITLTRLKKLEEALSLAQQVLPDIYDIQSTKLARQFIHYLQAELLTHFPNNNACLSFSKEAQRKLAVVLRLDEIIKEG